MIEAECTQCGEIFIPHDENDLIHDECGGLGEIRGEWLMDAPEPSPEPARRTLVVTYDVTGWTEEQIAYLAGEAVAQGEASEGHPDATVTTKIEEA